MYGLSTETPNMLLLSSSDHTSYHTTWKLFDSVSSSILSLPLDLTCNIVIFFSKFLVPGRDRCLIHKSLTE